MLYLKTITSHHKALWAGAHKSLDTSNCIDALKSAITRHGAPEIINSDQGYVFQAMVGH